MKEMIRIYVAGALSGTAQQYLENMRRMMSMSTHLWNMGMAPYCPCLDYHYALMRGELEERASVEQFYRASLAYVEVCHAVLVLPNAENSKGTKGEIDRAVKRNVPVFTRPSEIMGYFSLPPDPTLDVLFEKWEAEKV